MWFEEHGPEERQPPLGETPSVHPDATIRRSELGPWTAIGEGSQIVESEVGAYSYCTERCDIIYSRIGRFCSIASDVRINPGNHPMWRATQHHFVYRAQSYGLGADEESFFDWRRAQPVTLGHDVWVGHGAIILPGVSVGPGAVVGAGAVVTRQVEPYVIVAGVPAKPIGRRFEPDIAERLIALAWWDWPHDELRAALDDFRRLPIDAFLDRYEAAKG